jgi:nitrogen PTS system EIIA component
VLRQPGVLERLRAAHDADAIYAVLMENSAPQAA